MKKEKGEQYYLLGGFFLLKISFLGAAKLFSEVKSRESQNCDLTVIKNHF